MKNSDTYCPVYLQPNLQRFKDLDEYQKGKPYNEFDYAFQTEEFTISELIKSGSAFILAEPGYGKTMLLNKIMDFSEEMDASAVMINLKSMRQKDSVIDAIRDAYLLPNSRVSKNYRESALNESIVCLDSFDEVGLPYIEKTILELKRFIEEFPAAKIYIASRDLYFRRYMNQFVRDKLGVVVINSFNRSDIQNYLNDCSISWKDIDSILNLMYQSGQMNTLQTPRYLALLAKSFSDSKNSHLTILTRCKLFEKFVFEKLDKEKEILKTVDKDLVKRMLESLALTMEIYQVNQITKDELMTFFSEIQNDIKLSILSQTTIQEFVDRSILKDNIENIEYENREFQEYLAARELSRFKKLEQSLYELCVNQECKEIIPSMYNVLSFLLEMKPELIKSILEFAIRNRGVVPSGFHHLITGFNSNSLNEETKLEIFKVVYSYYYEHKLSMESKLAANLSYFYSPKVLGMILNDIEKQIESERNIVIINNLVRLIYELLQRDLLTKEQILECSKRFKSILKCRQFKKSYKIGILYRAELLKDSSIVEFLKRFPKDATLDELDSLIGAASRISSNNDFTLNITLSGIRLDLLSSVYSAMRFSEKDILQKFFKHLIEDEELGRRFIKKSCSINSDVDIATFTRNIQAAYDKEMEESIIGLLTIAAEHESHYLKQSKLFVELMKNLSIHSDSFTNNLINSLIENKNVLDFQIRWLIIMITDVRNFYRIKDTLKSYPELNSEVLPELYYSMKSIGSTESNEIHAAGNELFPSFYENRLRNEMSTPSFDDIDSQGILNDFQNELEKSTTESYNCALFSNFSKYYEAINESLTIEQLQRFKEILSNFLVNHDPSNSYLKVYDVKDGSSRIEFLSYIKYYGSAIDCAAKLKVNFSTFRQNAVSFIPFAFYNELNTILTYLGDLSNEELERVIEIYKSPNSDFWKFSLTNLLTLIEKYKIKSSEKFLLSLLEYESHSQDWMFNKTKIIELIDSFRNNKEYLQEIFFKNKDSEKNNRLAMRANEILISKYEDADAIEFRINEVIERAKPRRRKFSYTVSKRIDEFEEELISSPFASPLFKVSNPSFKSLFVRLLNESFRLEKKDKNYVDYSNYMRSIAFSFFRNLKVTKNLKHFDELEMIISNAKVKEETRGRCKDQIGNIKREYVAEVAKVSSMSEAIEVYNSVKHHNFITIGNSDELFEIVKNTLCSDLSLWCIGEGSKMVSKKSKFIETDIQKIIALKLENLFLTKGFKHSELVLYREVQSLEDKKPDFLIDYGFLTPIMIEFKLDNHSEMKSKDFSKTTSFKSFQNYVNTFSPSHSILLVYNNELDKEAFLKLVNKLKKSLKSMESTYVIGIP